MASIEAAEPRMPPKEKRASAFITTKKGTCYLTIKCLGRNFNMMRIRSYTIDAEEKRFMRRWYPDVDLDWKKIGQPIGGAAGSMPGVPLAAQKFPR